MAADASGPVDGPGSKESRLDSWKEIAAYLNRHVTTVRRWEKHEGLPVHRHVHDKLGSVYAFRAELDRWWHSRRVQLESQQGDGCEPTPGEPLQAHRWLILGGPVALCALIAIGYLMSPGRSIDSRPPAITSLAVLPLDNLSNDAAQEYFAEGITEALIGQLAKIGALRVVSRTSVMVFKGSRTPLPEIARALGVDAVVQGSIQRAGDRVRVSIRLIDGRSDAHLWARDFERESKDILELQAAVARAVGEEIRIQVTSNERGRMATAGSVNPAAYQEYLIGRYHLWRDNEENLQRAIAHFERATDIDPRYAAAYASLAHAWWKRGLWGQGEIGLEDAETPARIAARKALELDETLPDAYVVLADLERLYSRNLVRAEARVTQALALHPRHVDAHYTYALLLMELGRFPEAITHMETAEELDPLSPAIQSDFGRVLYRARKFDEAILRLNRALELEPEVGWLVYSRLAAVHEQLGQYDLALAALQQAGGKGAPHMARLARVLARMGDHREAKRLLTLVEADPSRFAQSETAAVYVALGDRDKAFALLFDRLERGDPGPNFIAVDPPLAELHSDPRWAELLRRMNVANRTHEGTRRPIRSQ